ncbi:TPA: hypothetical protein NN398_005952, partial [Pseudomonas aeruginosa]|nr:hypothetical protein [Pseudomonas aeruginosa]
DVIDTRANKLVKTHKINEITGPLARMTLSRDGERAYLVSDDRVTVLGTRALDVLGEVTVTKNPSCVLESPDGSHLYVADYSGVVTAARIAPRQTPDSGDADHPDAAAAWLFDVPQWEPALA